MLVRSKFFHAQASERRKQNTIVGIWDEAGNWCDEKESIAHAAINYFENIYTTTHPEQIEDITAAIPARVMDDMNEGLDCVFTREEVVTALKQIHPTKLPAPTVCLLYFIRNIGMLWVMVSLTWSLMFSIIIYLLLILTKLIFPSSQKQTTQRK